MSLKTNKRIVVAKIESSYGVDSTATGANAILLRNLTVTPLDGETATRDLIRPYFGNSDILVATTMAKLDFEVELAGAGAAGTAPAYGPLLRACAMSETISAGVSVTYAPISATLESVSICGKCQHAQMNGVYGTCKYPLPVLARAVQAQVLDYFTDAAQCPSYKAE